MSAPADHDGDGDEVRLAARGIRLAAFVLDSTIVIVLLLALVVLGQLTGVWNKYLIVAVPVLAFIYYVSVAVWLTDGLTIGKAVCNIRVRRVKSSLGEGSMRAFGWSVGRHSLGYIVIDMLGIGVLWSFIQRRRRCLHDFAFSTEVVVCWTSGALLGSPTERLKQFQQRVESAMHDLHERYGWAFFLWRWLTRLIVLPITVLVVSRSALASAATHAATTAPTAAASGATSLSAPAATALWATTATVTGLLVGQLEPDGVPSEPAGTATIIAPASSDWAGAITGTWRGDWGQLVIREVGDEVRAAYSCCSTGGILLEPVGDDEFAGWWLEDEGTDYGLLEFRLTEDGGLDGRWRREDEEWKEDWDVSPVDEPPEPLLVDRLEDDQYFAQIEELRS